MKLHTPVRSATAFAILLSVAVAHAQGTFQNLNFESASLTPVPAGQYGGFVPIGSALPWWTGYSQTPGTNEVAQVLQNNLTLGVASIDILGPFWSGGGILEGQYSVTLQESFPDRLVVPSIGQTGTIPSDAESVRFYALPYQTLPRVSFAGNQIPLSNLGGSASTYYLWGGNISTFAGQTGELRFWGDMALDNIFFSDQPVPEPSVLGLSALGALLVGWQCWRRRR
jgi:hypothetical protein